MIRFASEELDRWLKSTDRKPLVMRGARQVGKTWLVRDFAKRHKLELIELNLEKYPYYADLFLGNNPRESLKNIEAQLTLKIIPESSCLFLDEIQAAPELLAKLRWFREEMPELPVIAVGSLLEFALGKAEFSMPVDGSPFFISSPSPFSNLYWPLEMSLCIKNDVCYPPGTAALFFACSVHGALPPILPCRRDARDGSDMA